MTQGLMGVDYLPRFRQVFELCRVTETETVALLTEPGTRESYVVAAFGALRALGARVFQVVLPSRGDSTDARFQKAIGSAQVLRGMPAVVTALKQADMVVDLTVDGLLYSPEQMEILRSGTRILMVNEPFDILERMMPTAEIRAKVLRAVDLLTNADEWVLTSPAGTEFRCGIRGRKGVGQYGLSDQPGRWDHWPSAMAHILPLETEANGTVVMDRGDILYPHQMYIREPVICNFQDGYLRSIEGGLEAEFLRDYMERWHDPEGYGMSHVSWGMHPHGLWNALLFKDRTGHHGMDARSMLGGVVVSTGPNVEYGGSRETPCHIDICLRNCTLRLDGTTIIEDGAVVHEDLRF